MSGRLSRRAAMIGGALALPGCATMAQTPVASAPLQRPPRLLLTPDRLMRITVCTRPFRAAGPRIEAEKLDDKRIVHNYGHGGAGWSLSWGSAAIAAELALQDNAQDVAVIGAGAMGLTTAVRLAQSGAKVTIYAKEMPPESRSARATGAWTPDTRIALADQAPTGFAERWEAMTRASYAAHLAYVGQDSDPVEWTERYALRDIASMAAGVVRPPYQVKGFASLHGRVDDLTPSFRDLGPTENPFPFARARYGVTMTFNVAVYAQTLLNNFLAMGGRIQRATFATPRDVAALPQRVIVNCTGYGAKSLWNDESLIPVRGQIAWLAPQREAHYGIYFRNINVLARRDGVVVQDGGAVDDSWGYGLDDETPDHAEFERALALTAPLFRDWPRV
jgi:glycine/D-amino acid oxidase-like deaminating enzyme